MLFEIACRVRIRMPNLMRAESLYESRFAEDFRPIFHMVIAWRMKRTGT